MPSLEKRLWDSDDSSPLTHEAAREIERLKFTIEKLTNELSARAEKIIELDREVRGLREPDGNDPHEASLGTD
jgi:predicted RNase H-like nuclease (RuvC/YqgF family)